ncbi:hypothetical protein Q4I30_004364 [Leishmania utingensis]|uniref:Uncharacterized protein n=1 Tax=Leishmania utingensis TaxID=653362 RepID=A0AAW3AH05_9TRYP
MASVYLFDVSYLAPFEAYLPWRSSEPPLSWRCAAELTQWTSLMAVGDAWVAACAEATAATATARTPVHNKFVTPDVEPCRQEWEGYTLLSNDEDSDQAKAAASSAFTPMDVGALHRHMYVIHAFPSTVLVQNKYFSTTLALVTGALLRAPSSHGHDCISMADQCDITADLLRRCPSAKTRSSTSASHDHDGGGYGGVLLARIAQDPSEVPWHAFPRSGCLFHVIMVFHNSEADVNVGKVAAATPESLAAVEAQLRGEDADVCCRSLRNATLPTGDSLDDSPTSLQQLKERWRYFAAENGYECVFHATVCPPRALAHMAASMESGGRELSGSAEDIQLECVNVASGRCGLLEAPLAGSNRLYQILCNTLWPVSVRCVAAGLSGTRRNEHGEQENNAVMRAPKPLNPHSGNTFVVVGTDEEAMWRLFRQHEDGCARLLRRRFRFFTSVVSPPADPAAALHYRRVVLVNRYYAAVVHPRLLQTTFFDIRMQELLDRYWEQHIIAEEGGATLCPDAPAVVLWPPCSLAPRAACVETEARGTATIPADADGEDVRASYPPLEVILDSLVRRGCRDVVVMVSECRASAVPSGLTAYETLMCGERDVEVVQSDPVRFKAASVDTIDIDVDGPPVPVIRDEDDTRATRGVDRLHELLHCVQWGQTHRMTCAASPTACLADRRGNSLLLLACGRTPFEEEAWVRDVLAALTAAPSRALNKTTAVSADDYLRLAAPTVAVALGATHGDDSADLGAHPAKAAVAVDVSTSYFKARVEVHTVGGLQSYYAAPPTQHSAATQVMPPGWEDAHDAYVVVTTLCALQEAARAIAGSVRHTKVNNPNPADTVSGSHGTLSTVIRTLSQRQKEEWLAERIDAYVAHPTSEASDTAADSPLVLVYITDVTAADTARAELVEKLLCVLARPTAAPSATSLDVDSSDSREGADSYVPIEVVFASESVSESVSVATSAATTGRYKDLVVDGTARVREAFEQHLWPHRQSLSQQHHRASNPQPTTTTTEDLTSPRGAVGVASATSTGSFANGGTRASPRPVAAASAAAVEASATTRARAAVPSETMTVDVSWIAPVIGCALPNGFLVDPETLRSVPVRALRGAPWNTATIADVESADVLGRQDDSEAPAQHRKPLSGPLDEEELVQWTQKMRHYGHRLGESLREEQAETLALALEKMV